MSRTFKVWLDSGANIHSCRKFTLSLEKMGLSDEDFDEMDEEEKDEMFKEYAFERLDWGWTEE